MKKYIIILFSLFYFAIASGITMNFHYCGGKLKKISLFSNDEDGCCGNKMKSKNCCKNKTTVIKVEENHQASKLAQVSNPTVHLLAVLSTQLLFNIPTGNEVHITSNYHAHPVFYDNPLYLKHRVLLI